MCLQLGSLALFSTGLSPTDKTTMLQRQTSAHYILMQSSKAGRSRHNRLKTKYLQQQDLLFHKNCLKKTVKSLYNAKGPGAKSN